MLWWTRAKSHENQAMDGEVMHWKQIVPTVHSKRSMAYLKSLHSPFNFVDIGIIKAAWPRGYKTFSCSTQLSTKFILLINVKMPTIVDILTFISMINTTSERLKARNFYICRYFSFDEQLKFCAQLG